MSNPLVSVICLCYNHERFVIEALESVLNQTYAPVQLIVVDDASEDHSKDVIADFLRNHPEVTFVPIEQNRGNCAAFNTGLRLAEGEFVIDFAADDVLLPGRLEKGVKEFLPCDKSFGVQFGDAELVDENGGHLGFHSDRFPHHLVPQGDVYIDLIQKYFICGPTMMVRKEVFDRLNGFDESLAYEDFDFWIRSSREFKYFYVPEVFVKRRVVKGSMSEKQFRRGNVQQRSTLRVCEKIFNLNRTEAERKALSHRIRYEILQCIRRGDFLLAGKYLSLWGRNWVAKYPGA